MTFYIKKVILWLINGKLRVLDFEPNKVNVITGESNTGKTAILEIIDYCLFSSSPKISESIINENVLWYGISIEVNDKNYVIARERVDSSRPSSNYYFSSIGEIPENPENNNDENSIKALIETEFSIDNNASIPFGGSSLKLGSKISLRYFLPDLSNLTDQSHQNDRRISSI